MTTPPLGSDPWKRVAEPARRMGQPRSKDLRASETRDFSRISPCLDALARGRTGVCQARWLESRRASAASVRTGLAAELKGITDMSQV
jgi:hypothetical protein